MQILLKYGDVKYPTHCEHDVIDISDEYDPATFSKEDVTRLKTLGFEIEIEGEKDDEGDEILESRIYSFKYGSC